MKNYIVLIFLCFQPLLLSCQSEFSKWFSDGSLRVDFILAGNKSNSQVYLQSLKKEPFWGGSKINLIDTLNYGEYLCKVFPDGSNNLIYSKGFSTLFQEWQTTAEALKIDKGFYQSSLIPFPKETVRFEIYERDKSSSFILKLSVKIDPADYFIQPSPGLKFNVDKLKISGEPANCVDIVFIPEGYTENQMGKFKADILRLTDSLFSIKPFSNYRNKFNLYAILAPSEEQGTDIPGKNIWKNTIVNSGFYTFDSERYLTTLDFWKVRDIAALAPCDHICILVNTKKYGGGGVYDYYTLTSASNELSPQVFIHEFGHGLAGLGDEYYTSDVSYIDYYSTKIEPWEPNLTTLVNFSAKWKNQVDPKTPVPTPVIPEFINSTGVFEGGGYVAKGVYRPAFDCRMKTNNHDSFCKVCQLSIEKMILFLTQ